MNLGEFRSASSKNNLFYVYSNPTTYTNSTYLRGLGLGLTVTWTEPKLVKFVNATRILFEFQQLPRKELQRRSVLPFEPFVDLASMALRTSYFIPKYVIDSWTPRSLTSDVNALITIKKGRDTLIVDML